MTHRALRAAVTAVLAMGTAAGPAQADSERRFWGELPRGGEIRAGAFPNGRFGAASVDFRVRCPEAGLVARGSVAFEGELVERSRREMSGTGTNDVEVPGYDAFVDGALTGRRHLPRGRPGLERWAGLLDLEVRLRRDDRLVERCRMRGVRWVARRESFGRFSWQMTGEPGDFINGGRSVAYGAEDELTAFGDRREVVFAVDARNGDEFTAEFAAPAGERLRAGRTYRGGVDVSGNHRACTEIDASFTVEAARFDPRGRMRRFSVRFEQRCDGATAALRGRLSFRATAR